MPTFPLIGRDFDALAGQQQFWAGLSNQNEIGNIQRQQSAQQNANNWLATASQLRDRAQQQNVGLQLSADQQAREEAARREDEARKASQFAAQLGWSKTSEEARLAAEDRRTVSAENIAKANRDWQDKQIAANLDADAQSLAMQLSPVKKAYDSADSAVKKAEAEQTALEDRKLALQKKAATDHWYSPGSGLTEDEKLELGNIPTKEKQIQASLNPKSPLMQQHAQYSRALERLMGKADTAGFDVDFEGGKITHPRSGKSWNFHSAMQSAAPQSSAGFPTMPPVPVSAIGASFFNASQAPQQQPQAGPAPFAGFTPPTVGTGTLPPPQTNAPSRMWIRDANGKLVPAGP